MFRVCCLLFGLWSVWYEFVVVCVCVFSVLLCWICVLPCAVVVLMFFGVVGMCPLSRSLAHSLGVGGLRIAHK